MKGMIPLTCTPETTIIKLMNGVYNMLKYAEQAPPVQPGGQQQSPAAVGSRTAQAGQGYAPAEQEDHKDGGGDNPSGKALSALRSIQDRIRFDNPQGTYGPVTGNMPPAPANMATPWVAEENRKRMSKVKTAGMLKLSANPQARQQNDDAWSAFDTGSGNYAKNTAPAKPASANAGTPGIQQHISNVTGVSTQGGQLTKAPQPRQQSWFGNQVDKFKTFGRAAAGVATDKLLQRTVGTDRKELQSMVRDAKEAQKTYNDAKDALSEHGIKLSGSGDVKSAIHEAFGRYDRAKGMQDTLESGWEWVKKYWPYLAAGGGALLGGGWLLSRMGSGDSGTRGGAGDDYDYEDAAIQQLMDRRRAQFRGGY